VLSAGWVPRARACVSSLVGTMEDRTTEGTAAGSDAAPGTTPEEEARTEQDTELSASVSDVYGISKKRVGMRLKFLSDTAKHDGVNASTSSLQESSRLLPSRRERVCSSDLLRRRNPPAWAAPAG